MVFKYFHLWCADNAALFKQVNMTGEKFFPGTGTELKHLTGDKAVDNDLSTDLSRCALAYRWEVGPAVISKESDHEEF